MSLGNHTVMIIGQNGFIGSNLVNQLKDWCLVRPVSIRSYTDFENLNFDKVDVIIYTAGLAHNRQARSAEEYQEINWKLPIKFANYAKQKEVSQFVYLSSIKVYGEFKTHTVLTENTEVNPLDLYGKCKLNAERDLLELAEDSFAVAILRLPLVYGPGVKGNLETLVKYVAENRLIPFKGFNGRRSMLSMTNLLHYVKSTIELNTSDVLLLADRNTLTTSQLCKEISKHLGEQKIFLNVGRLLNAFLSYFKPEMFTRLCCDLIVDNDKTLKVLNLELQDNSEKVIEKMTKFYLAKHHD